MEAEAIMAIIGAFGAPVLIIWAIVAHRARAHRASMDALSTIAQNGTTVTPELVQSLGVRPRLPYANLRTGLVWLAIGLGLLILSVVSPDADPGSWALALIPVLIGAVFLILWVYADRKRIE